MIDWAVIVKCSQKLKILKVEKAKPQKAECPKGRHQHSDWEKLSYYAKHAAVEIKNSENSSTTV